MVFLLLLIKKKLVNYCK